MLLKRQPATEEPRGLVERLAQALGAEANATNIFAPPIERDGVTVIPVAKAVYGFGGGGGRQAEDEGSGGGGGAVVTPVGYIEIAEGVTRFRPIRDPLLVAACGAASGIVAWWLGKYLMRR